MPASNLSIALRQFRKNKGFAALNIIGLAMGIASCLLIVLYVTDERSYDKYNVNADRIYRIDHEVKFGGNHLQLAQAPADLGPEIVRQFPQVEQYTRFAWHDPIVIKKGTENLRELKVVYADSSLFDVFTLPMLAGNPHTALVAPRTVVITAAAARKYFGNDNPLGQSLLINNNDSYTITGIIKDIPATSHFHFDFFLPMCENEDSRNETDGWISENYNTYLLFKPGADAEKMLAAFDRMQDAHVGPLLKSTLNISLEEFKQQGSFVRNRLTPLLSIYLHSGKMGELGANGNSGTVDVFSVIAVFILLIACFNFMNLSTARSAGRAKDVGVRKLLGAGKKSLVVQFLTESVLMSALSIFLAIGIAVLLLPAFNKIAGKDLRVYQFFQPAMALTLGLILLVVGIMAGSYPAFFLSGFQPIRVLKGKLAAGFKHMTLRNALVVFQFTISVILIAATGVIYKQLAYIRHADAGFNRQQVLVIQNTSALKSQATAFREALLNMAGISAATMTGYLPVDGDRSSDAFFTTPTLDASSSVLMQKWKVDANYLPALGITLVAGRNFYPGFPADSNAIIINEAAAKLLGRGNPVNLQLYRMVDMATKRVMVHRVVGVVKNFNFNSFRDLITPLALRYGNDNSSIAVRISSNDIAATLGQIKNKWQAFTSTDPFIYSFMDEQFNALYSSEEQAGKLLIIFANLAILVACLGLFGLAASAAEQRTREIGIRKVLGATAVNIAGMLSKDFLMLVLIASLIAFPIAWYAMQQWLQQYAYRVSIPWWIFAVAGLAALLLSLVTVLFHAIKAGVRNPVTSLRSE